MGKQKKATNTASITESKTEYTWLLLFCIAPLCQGYYNDALFFGAALFLSITTFILLKKAETFTLTLIDIFLLSMVLWSALSLIWCSNIYETVKIIAFNIFLCMVFFCAKQFFIKGKEFRIELWYELLFYLGIFLTAQNILLYFFQNYGEEGFRFTYGIPYSNTLAIVLCISILCGIYQLREKNLSTKGKAWHFLGIIFVFIGLVFTYSRTVWALGFLAILCWSIYLFRTTLQKQKKKTYTIIFGSIIMIALFFVADFLFSLGILERIKSIRLSATELTERFAYYHDALLIFKENLFSGLGFGGWYSRQFQFQTAIYNSRYVHSMIFQPMVDGGIIYLLLFLTVVLYPLAKGIKYFLKTPIIQCALISNLVLVLHSCIDFDFSFPMVFALFLVNQGIILLHAGKQKTFSLPNNIKPITASCLLLLMPLFFAFTIGETLYNRGITHYLQKNYAAAETPLSIAWKIMPFHNEALFLTAKNAFEDYRKTGNENNYHTALAALDKAKAVDPENYRYFFTEGNFKKEYKDYKGSVKAYTTSLTYRPLWLEGYTALESSGEMLQKEATAKNNAKDIALANEVLENIPILAKTAEEKCSEWAYRLKNKPELVQIYENQ